jgi:hypothetical protein
VESILLVSASDWSMVEGLEAAKRCHRHQPAMHAMLARVTLYHERQFRVLAQTPLFVGVHKTMCCSWRRCANTSCYWWKLSGTFGSSRPQTEQ